MSTEAEQSRAGRRIAAGWAGRSRPFLVSLALLAVFSSSEAAIEATLRMAGGTDEKVSVSGYRNDGLLVSRKTKFGLVESSVPLAQIERLAFHPDAKIRAALADPSGANAGTLARYWAFLAPVTAKASGQAGQAAVAYAKAMLDTKDAANWNRVLELQPVIAGIDAGNTGLAAESLGLAAVANLRLGKLDEALRIADQLDAMAAEIDDSNRDVLASARILALFTRAAKSAAALAELEEEWPKWELMPLVRRNRLELIESALDGYLVPSVLYPDQRERCAEGLFRAAELEKRIGRPSNARQYAGDILSWYADTGYRDDAQALLDSLDSPSASPSPPPST